MAMKRVFRKVVCIVLLLGVLGCSLLPVTNFSAQPVFAQSQTYFAPLALKALEVTAYPLAVTENTEASITFTLRDITSASTPTAIAPDSLVTVMVGNYTTTGTVETDGKTSVTLPPEVVTGSRLVGVVIVPGYQRMVFSLIVKPMQLKDNALTVPERSPLELELQIGRSWCRVNDKPTKLPVAPYLREGRTMVPVRFFAEVLGYTVDYDFSDPAMKKVMIYTPDNVSNAAMDEKQQPEKNNRPFITLFIDQTTVIIGGISVEMDTTPELVRGTTMVPLRFVAQTLGYYVDWMPPLVKLTSSF
ncbi:copper amine oxidase N-terminal domain-containing protein [Coprothermobacter proteolyticus]|uniref:copper amine oxidase N-terminal domain-containing protein n=2 Tax=Coprothermobacter proteolyticus TaxID=35786 RepID=UPI000D31161D|nr:copper amine oxidase N-terminal domain-containing protein [Coprothermobacter proteolyticus]